MLRGVVVALGLVAAGQAVAGEMGVEEARRFVIGKMFSYTCFEGTRGAGRVFSDGSVVGSIQIRGEGPVRNAWLPAGTIKIKNERVCGSMKGMPVEPCFNLDKTNDHTFRGSISGIGFAYCDFTRHRGKVRFASDAPKPEKAEKPRRTQEASAEPLSLRATLAADKN